MVKLIYWIKKNIRKDKQCSKCCMVCEYYEICKEDN